jgi:hypothetical protein
MPIKPCHDCERELTTNAEMCTHYGAPVRRGIRCSATGILVIGVLAGIGSCASPIDHSPRNQSTPIYSSHGDSSRRSPREEALATVRLEFHWSKTKISTMVAVSTMVATLTIANQTNYTSKT